jgi:hypothetical protein
MTFQDLGSIGEVVAAVATILTLIYLSIQLRGSNRLARASASRAPNSDLNAINAAFGVEPAFRPAWRKIMQGAERPDIEPDERTLIDFYLISITNLYEQLAREIRSGVVGVEALDFGATGCFKLPYYRTSWAAYKEFLSTEFVKEFEERFDLDPNQPVEL